MFYTYSQNNSGGIFDVSEKDGVGQYVIVEANDEDEAFERIVHITRNSSGSCSCCGSRWEFSSPDIHDSPKIYEEPIGDYQPIPHYSSYRTDVFIHFRDKKVQHFKAKAIKEVPEGVLAIVAHHKDASHIWVSVGEPQ